MIKLNLEIHDSLIDIQSKIKNINDIGIELVIPNGALLLDNVVNIKVLKRIAQREGKVLTFTTEDPNGKLILELAEEGVNNITSPYIEYTPKPSIMDKFKGLQINNPFKNIKAPKISGFIPLVIVLILITGIYILLKRTYKASSIITVESQDLTRSVTIKVKKDANTDYINNILKGTTIQETLQNSGSQPTTGVKYTGTKSKGTVTVYNKTDTDKSFDKGELIVYKDGDTEYTYKLLADTDVSAATESTDSEGNPVIYPGEKEVEVEATDYGDEYNLKSGKSLNFDDYKSSQYNAKVKKDIDGGKKESKKAIDAKDLETLKETVLKNNTEKVQSLLNKRTDTNKYIKGSESNQVLKEEFDGKTGDEKELLTLNQTITTEALAYNQSDLDNLLESVIKGLIPNGYEIAKQNKDIKVDILGSSSTSVLSKTEADLQVTIKVSIIPTIDIEKLKNDIKSKTLTEAQKVLGSINNVKKYELTLFPNLPILRRIPNNMDNIDIVVEKE